MTDKMKLRELHDVALRLENLDAYSTTPDRMNEIIADVYSTIVTIAGAVEADVDCTCFDGKCE